MKLKMLFCLWLAVAALLALVAAPLAVAQGVDNSKECSLRTLHGTYGVLIEGTVVQNPIPFLLNPPYHFVISGTVTFDGKGNASTRSRQSFGGFIFPAVPGTGTYNVNPDCTFSSEFPHFGSISHRAGVITAEGIKQEIHNMYEDVWWVASGAIKKMPEGSCSLATLNGTYALFGNGTMSTPPLIGFPTVTQVAQVGILTFDGAGNFSGQDTTNKNGAVVPDAQFTGAYNVNSDCTASATFHTIDGDIHEEGVITGAEDFLEFRGIFTDVGWAFAQTLKKQ